MSRHQMVNLTIACVLGQRQPSTTALWLHPSPEQPLGPGHSTRPRAQGRGPASAWGLTPPHLTPAAEISPHLTPSHACSLGWGSAECKADTEGV